MNLYLEENHILNDHQSGFRSKHSLTTAILRLTEDIHKSISSGKCVVLVLLDFANAFGSVDHGILMQILKSVGLENRTLMWYQKFSHGMETIGQTRR